MSSDEDRERFVWFDLMTSDPNAAVAFYTDLFGWGTQQWEGRDQPYTMWTNGGQPLGGQVLKCPMEMPGGDQIAQCMDPQRAMFAVHSSPR